MIIILCIFTSCNNKSISKPSITIDSTIQKLTEEELKVINLDENESINNLRKYTLKVTGSNLISPESRTINIPTYGDIKNLLINSDKDIWCVGNSSSEDNSSNNYFNYNYEMIIYMKNFSADYIKNLLNNLKIHIQVKDVNDSDIIIENKLGDCIN